MGLISYTLGQQGIILRVLLLDSSSTTGAGLTGVAYNTTGLVITDIADNEAAAALGYYSVADSTIENITTIGTFAAPSSTGSNNVGYKARFKEVSSTYFPGLYELHLSNTRFAVSSAKYLIVRVAGVTNMVPTMVLIPLTQVNPYDAVRGGMTALPNATAGSVSGLPINGSAWTPSSITCDSINTDTFDAANGLSVTSVDIDDVIWNSLTSGMATAGSIGKKLADATFGSGGGDATAANQAIILDLLQSRGR